MRLARNQLPPPQPLLLHCHRLTLLQNPPGAAGLLTHPKIHLCSISPPLPEHPNTFLSATASGCRWCSPGSTEPSLPQTLPGNLFQEEQSPEKNMFTTVNRIVYRCGEQARHGKISAMVPASEALPGLLSAAAAPQGPCMAPAVPWGVTSQGVTCDRATCCSSQRCQPWQPAASPRPLPGGAAGSFAGCQLPPRALRGPRGTTRCCAHAGHTSNLPLRALLGGRGKGERVLKSKAMPTDQTFLGN